MNTRASVSLPVRAILVSVVTTTSLLAAACSLGQGDDGKASPEAEANVSDDSTFADGGETPEPPLRTELGGTHDVAPYPGGVGCGSPAVDPAVDGGMFIWKACDESGWTLLLSGDRDAEAASAMGRIFSDVGFVDVVPRSTEPSDVLNTSELDLSTYFMLTTGSPWDDRFEFTVPFASELCIDVAEGPPLYVGPDRIPAGGGKIDPATLGTCEIPPPYDDCADPRVNTSTDSGLFVWKSCYGFWMVQLTGTHEDGGLVSAAGTFSTSLDRFDSIVPRFVESSDTVTASPAPFEPIAFDLRTINPWSDRLYVASFGAASLCVTIERASEGLEVFVGGDRTSVGRTFDPETLGPCL